MRYTNWLLSILAVWLGVRLGPGEPVGREAIPRSDGYRSVAADSLPARFNWGKPASSAQIAALDTDVRPDGTGLPAGSGTATTGAVIFAAKCAACHGAGGIGGPNGSLVTTTPAPGKRPEKVIGNYWPYATTIFDYIRRAMPFNQPGSLSDNEVYALTAYLLTANKLLDEKTVGPSLRLNAQMLPTVVMPAQKLFVPDDRKGSLEIR
jgi:cytochrome c